MSNASNIKNKMIEVGIKNDREAHVLLDLINSEFQSDPKTTAGFDRRIVERVKKCVTTDKENTPDWMR